MSSKIILKRYLPQDISRDLLDNIQVFLRSVYPTIPDNHIENNHFKQPNVEFYIAFLNQEVVGIFSYSPAWIIDPFNGKRTFLFSSWLFYRKNTSETKTISQKASFRFLCFHLGKAWFLKSFYLIGGTCNPRLYVQFLKHFPKVFVDYRKSLSEEELAFTNYCLSFTKEEKANVFSIKETPALLNKTNVTNKYDALFKTKNEAINEYFFRHKILIKEEGEVYINHQNEIVLLGYYSPIPALKMHLKRIFSLKQSKG